MLRLLIRAVLADQRFRRLGAPLLLVAGISVLAAFATHAWLAWSGSPSERATRLVAGGDFAAAERLRCDALVESFEFSVYFDLIETRALLPFFALQEIRETELFAEGALPPPESEDAPVVEESPTCTDSSGTLRDLAGLAAQAPGGAEAGPLAALFWHRLAFGQPHDDLRAELAALAERPAPARWANHVLARAALRKGDAAGAALHFDAEGRAHPEVAGDDLRQALEIWAHLEDWSALRDRAGDPLYEDGFTLRLRTRLAEEDRDWKTFLLLLWPSTFEGVTLPPVLLAILAGSLWFLFVARLGQVRDDLAPRLTLYGGAFVLGIISIYPTLLLITLQDHLVGWEATGEPLKDAIFYVFGVGFREELCKLLLFLPLLPLLLRRGSRLEALACGAMVGLGFAAEENISYFHHGDPSTALARFMTANFLHMALTGSVAAAVFDAARATKHRPTAGGDANIAFAMAVLLHGAYDFLLGLGDLAFFAMTVFVLLSQTFLRQVVASRSVSGQDLMRQFAVSLAVLAGAAFVYATALYGPILGTGMVLGGFLGVAVLIFMFQHELG